MSFQTEGSDWHGNNAGSRSAEVDITYDLRGPIPTTDGRPRLFMIGLGIGVSRARGDRLDRMNLSGGMAAAQSTRPARNEDRNNKQHQRGETDKESRIKGQADCNIAFQPVKQEDGGDHARD